MQWSVTVVHSISILNCLDLGSWSDMQNFILKRSSSTLKMPAFVGTAKHGMFYYLFILASGKTSLLAFKLIVPGKLQQHSDF